MVWLEAALAFAITMMVLSTIASMIVETVHRAFRMREKGLEQCLELLYEKEIWPKLDRDEGTGVLDKSQESEDFVARLCRTPFSDRRKKPKIKTDLGGWVKWVFSSVYGWLTNENKYQSLETLKLVESLVDTRVGQQIIRRAGEMSKGAGEEFKKDFVISICDKFESLGDSAKELFARQARLSLMVVGFLLAFGLNVDPVDLYKSYLNDPLLRQSVIARGEGAAEDLQRAIERLNKVQTDNSEADIKEIKEHIRLIKEGMVRLESNDIPISWDNAPVTPLWVDQGKVVKKVGRVEIVYWILSVTLGGFLIGLGGPFWFDTFRKLSAIAGVAQQNGSPGKLSKAESQKATPDTNAEHLILEVFRRSEKAIALNK